MQKLVLTCERCGQRMQVPRSAIGRSGVCPSCGMHLRITAQNTETASREKRGRFFSAGGRWWGGPAGAPTEDAKRRFGAAVDRFYAGHIAEALAVFDSLAQEYPGNPDIEAAREQCRSALAKKHPRALEHGPSTGQLPEGAALDEATVRRVVLEKLLHGRTEEIQLQAASIACTLLGLGSGASRNADAAAVHHEGHGHAPEDESGPAQARAPEEEASESATENAHSSEVSAGDEANSASPASPQEAADAPGGPGVYAPPPSNGRKARTASQKHSPEPGGIYDL